MNKFRFTLRDIARCSDRLQGTEEVVRLLSRVALPLTSLGISLVDNIVVMVTQCSCALVALTDVQYVVSGARILLDLAAQGLVTVSEGASDNSVIEYYFKYRGDYGDSVRVILDALVEVELELVRETPPYKAS